MKTKLIHILPRSPGSGYEKHIIRARQIYGKAFPKHFLVTKKFPFWVCFPEGDFHILLARAILNNSEKYDIECWRLYDSSDRVYTKKIDGVIHKIFPSRKIQFGKYFFGEKSPQLINELNREIDKGLKILVHLHGIHSWSFNYILSRANLSLVPLVATQRGAANPFLIVKKKPWYIYSMIQVEKLYADIDHFIIQAKVSGEYEFFMEKYDPKDVLLNQDGIDFTVFRPIEKQEARQVLDIDAKNKVLLHVGKLNKNKGIQNILWAYNNLKNYKSNIELIFVGASDKDDLYHLAKKSGAKVIVRVTRPQLNYYYNASDVYVYPSSSDKIRKFAGFSNANIEALACNTPVYTSQLNHFLGTDDEKKLLGLEFSSRSKMLGEIEYLLINSYKYNQCRGIVKKYYNREKNILNILDTYQKVEEKYFL